MLSPSSASAPASSRKFTAVRSPRWHARPRGAVPFAPHKLTLAFPAISCGVYGFPVERAAAIAVGEVRASLQRCRHVDSVLLVAFDEELGEILRRRHQDPVPGTSQAKRPS